MTTTKLARHEDVPEDVRQLAASYAGRMADVLLGEGDDPDFIAILADCVLADRSRRAKAPAQATELAPDVKGLVETLLHQLKTMQENGKRQGEPLYHEQSPLADTIGDLRSRLSAPPAEAKPVAWSVKPLEWRKLSDAKTADTYGCRSIAGFSFGEYFVNSSAYGSRWNFSRLGYAEIEAASEEDAQAAAQADYEQRTNSDIIVHPDPRAKAAEAVPEWGLAGMRQALVMLAAASRDVLSRLPPGASIKHAGATLTNRLDSITAEVEVRLAAAPQPLSTGEVNGE